MRLEVEPMPHAPARPCRHPGCRALTTDRSGLCQEHRRQARREYDRTRPSAAARGYGGYWQKVRAAKLRQDPLCERCLAKGVIREAWGVHHKDRNPTNNAPENLESICFECHEAEHAAERWRTRRQRKPVGEGAEASAGFTAMMSRS